MGYFSQNMVFSGHFMVKSSQIRVVKGGFKLNKSSFKLYTRELREKHIIRPREFFLDKDFINGFIN